MKSFAFIFLFAVDGFAQTARDLEMISTGYAAKEACSCVYVSGLPEDYCREFIKIPVGEISNVELIFGRETKWVTAKLRGTAQTAVFTYGRHGCQLL